MSTTSNIAELTGPSAVTAVRSVSRIPVLAKAVFVAVVLAFSSAVVSGDPVVAATVPAVNQCNGIDNVDGLSVTCDVTVVNSFDVASGSTSSILTTRECHGVAGDLGLCTNSVTSFDQLASSVTQCNDSGNGGGGTMTCTVSVVNNITGDGATSTATVNQCIGSGGGGGTTTECTPIESTTNATITQCNGSANGGGSTILCTVSPSTQTATLGVTVNQCNGSENGGGSLLTCTASITNNFLAAPPTTTPPTTTPGGTTPPTTPAVTVPSFGTVPAATLPATGPSSRITGISSTATLVVLAGALMVAATRRRAPNSR